MQHILHTIMNPGTLQIRTFFAQNKILTHFCSTSIGAYLVSFQLERQSLHQCILSKKLKLCQFLEMQHNLHNLLNASTPELHKQGTFFKSLKFQAKFVLQVLKKCSFFNSVGYHMYHFGAVGSVFVAERKSLHQYKGKNIHKSKLKRYFEKCQVKLIYEQKTCKKCGIWAFLR